MSTEQSADGHHLCRVEVESTPIEIIIRGHFAPTRRRFRDALARAVASSSRPVVFVRGTLERDRNPSVDEPVHAEAVVDLGESSVRAHATARTQAEAIQLLVHRLRRRLRQHQSRRLSMRRRPSRDGSSNKSVAHRHATVIRETPAERSGKHADTANPCVRQASPPHRHQGGVPTCSCAGAFCSARG
jgi:ribosome-associated translation inhibitor RaiA